MNYTNVHARNLPSTVGGRGVDPQLQLGQGAAVMTVTEVRVRLNVRIYPDFPQYMRTDRLLP